MPTTPVIYTNVRDTFVNANEPNKNWSNYGLLHVRQGGAGTHHTLLYVTRPIPLGVTVLSATLRLYQWDAWPATAKTVTVRRITSAWVLERVSYATAPTITTAGQTSLTKTGQPANTEWAFDVTAQVQAAADGAPWWGFRLEAGDSASGRFWAAEGSPTFRPVLEVSWSDAPDAPTQLAPAGNRAVSIAKPTLRFDFTDIGGDTSLQAAQVQINATNVWTAPTFDSGTVMTSEPQLDLNTTAYAGITAGATAWWRVRVQDGAGLWSAWSEGAQFRRVAKPTVTITNPAVSPNNFVEEPTPPISWTVAGGTQTAYQVTIVEVANPTQYVWTTGKITSTANTVTLPNPAPGDSAIITPGVAYRVSVSIWDNVARENTPGDAIQTTAAREFTYAKTATVTPVASLTVTPQAPYPWAQLQWTRATAPDSFSIVRTDNLVGASKVTATNLVPSDLLVSGTTYRYIDRDASPRRSTTWEVMAIVNGRTSSPNPTVSGSTNPTGIWLSDTARNVNVQILGRDGQASVDMTMPEKGETIDVVGSATPVRVTQALQGYSGHVAGALVTTDVMTAQAARQALFELKRYPSRSCILTLGDMTILVKAFNISVASTPNPDIDFDVEFDFFQIGTPFKAVL